MSGLRHEPRPVRRFYTFLGRALSRPRAPAMILLASMALLAFSLDTGMAADDYVHQLMLRGDDHSIAGFRRGPLDIFRFTTPETTPSLIRDGVVSWWANPEARLAFLRPVSAATHYIDHKLLGGSAVWMHLHSMLWGLLSFAGVWAVYRRLLGTTLLSTLALYLYALDDARCWAASWIAGRNTTVATALSVWVLYLHMRGREDRRTAGYGALALFVVALLAGEGTISICAYLFAYAMFIDRAALRSRLLSLLPYAAIVVAWRIPYRMMGYGVAHSAVYVDPTTQPLVFLGQLSRHGPVLLLSQLGGPWSDVWSALSVYPPLDSVVVAGALVALGIVGTMLWPFCRREPVIAFGVTGALLCVVPVSATFTSDRLLTWVAIGASLALARLIAPRLQPDAPGIGLGAMLVVMALVLSHVVLGPPVLASRARGNLALDDILSRADAGLPHDRPLEGTTAIYVNPPAVPLAAYVAIMRAAKGESRPDSQVWLATGTADVHVTRLDSHTLRVAPDGGFLQNIASMLLQDLETPFRVGQVVQLRGARITVTAVHDGRPQVIEARFPYPLEDPRLIFRRWVGETYVPFTPPPVGESVVVPKVDYMKVVFGKRPPLSAVIEGND